MTDWSRDREPGVGEWVVWLWSVPTSRDSSRAADAAYDTSRLLSALATDRRRQVLSVRRSTHGLL